MDFSHPHHMIVADTNFCFTEWTSSIKTCGNAVTRFCCLEHQHSFLIELSAEGYACWLSHLTVFRIHFLTPHCHLSRWEGGSPRWVARNGFQKIICKVGILVKKNALLKPIHSYIKVCGMYTCCIVFHLAELHSNMALSSSTAITFLFRKTHSSSCIAWITDLFMTCWARIPKNNKTRLMHFELNLNWIKQKMFPVIKNQCLDPLSSSDFSAYNSNINYVLFYMIPCF